MNTIRGVYLTLMLTSGLLGLRPLEQPTSKQIIERAMLQEILR